MEKEDKKKLILPISAQIEQAKGELSMNVLQIQEKYGLPSYLMDLLITSIVAEIRNCSHQENLVNIQRVNEQSEEEKHE